MDTDLEQRWHDLQRDWPSGARLLAVSKGHPAESIRVLASCGQLDFGESRLQEALPKLDLLADLGLRWHFIGRLQSNKVRGVVRAFPVIHSVDSLSLAERISRIAGEESRHPEILLQVKLREDPSKGGLSVNELEAAWDQLQMLSGVTITGLMTMAPQAAPMDERRALFQECRALATRFGLPECSMGMSGDWREAADAGATWLRLGSCLFGARLRQATSL